MKETLQKLVESINNNPSITRKLELTEDRWTIKHPGCLPEYYIRIILSVTSPRRVLCLRQGFTLDENKIEEVSNLNYEIMLIDAFTCGLYGEQGLIKFYEEFDKRNKLR